MGKTVSLEERKVAITLTLSGALLERLRKFAAETNQAMSNFVEAALQKELAAEEKYRAEKLVENRAK